MTRLATPRLRRLASRPRESSAGGAPAPGRAGDRFDPADHDGPTPVADGAAHAPPGGAPAHPDASPEHGRCDLCAEPLSPRHRHLVDLEERGLRCACRPCALLFDDDAAGGERYRLVPERVRRLRDFRLNAGEWAGLGVPVDLVFFLRGEDGVTAFYPGPVGATEARPTSEHWDRIEERNPALREMEPEVEALLVDRRDGEAEGWLVPVDECYRLAGILRTHWKGLAGGPEVHERIAAFFDALSRRTPAANDPDEEER